MTRNIVVIGGGLAGAAFAAEVAAGGRDVLVLEREGGPHHKVCGEFLSGEAVFYLSRLGLDLASLGAVPIGEVALSHGRRTTVRALPFPALSLSRFTLDAALLARAETAGAEVRRGTAVRELRRTGAGWAVRLDDGDEIGAAQVVLATGKHDLRGHGRPPGLQNDLIGLKQRLRLTDPDRMRGRVELGLFPGGYAGLEMVEDGVANLCLVVRGGTYAGVGRDWDALLAAIAAAAPAFGAHLAEATPLHPRPLAIARIPYGLVRAGSNGVWRLGDQAAVIPSFAGEGMSIALHSAHLAARALLAGETASTFQARLAGDVGARVKLAARLSQALVDGRYQRLAAGAVRAFPPALSVIAAVTRLPQAALARAA